MSKTRKAVGTIAAGFITGAALAIATSGMTSDVKKRRVKRQAQKTARSVGDFAKDISSIVRN